MIFNGASITLDTAEVVCPALRPEMMVFLVTAARPVEEGVCDRLETHERQIQPVEETGLPGVPPLVAMQIIHIF